MTEPDEPDEMMILPLVPVPPITNMVRFSLPTSFLGLAVILSILSTTYLVNCDGINPPPLNCTLGCDVLSNTRSAGIPKGLLSVRTTTISIRFQCPTGCVCRLGNHNITISCNGEASTIQVLYPPNIIDLSWSNTGLHGIALDAFAELMKSLYKLDMSNNLISTLHSQQFRGFTKLVILDLSNNHVTRLYPEQFEGIAKLWSLYLSHNNIVELHAQQFHGLVQLKVLEFSSNAIEELHPDQFDTLRQLEVLDMSNNYITTLQPLQFKGLLKLRRLYMPNNNILDLHPEQFLGLTNLIRLNFCGNDIIELHPLQFDGLVSLWDICISHNDINELLPRLFQGLKNLLRLQIASNNIAVLHPELFQGLGKLEKLYLPLNDIAALHPRQFEELVGLRQLSLSNNHIAMIHPDMFRSLNKLRILDLGCNNLISVTPFIFITNRKLVYLSLANNKFSHFPRSTFQYMNHLRYLDMSGNKLNSFDARLYFVNNSMKHLDIVDMRRNKLQMVNHDSFSGFGNSTQILVDNDATCCFVETGNCTATIPGSQFLTCGRLLSNQVQRVAMWILGIFAVFSNAYVLVYRFRRRHVRDNKVQLLLISNLSLSDFIMGIYMIIIASADVYYRGYFPSEAWRSSITCKIAGTLSILSSEASVFFVTLISVDRFMGIRFTYSKSRLDTASSRIAVTSLWALAILLSITSTILTVIDPDYYDVSEVCTGLPLSTRHIFQTKYWQYDLGIKDSEGEVIVFNNTLDIIVGARPGIYFGIAVFTSVNFLCVLTVLICYVGIFMSVRQTVNQSGRNPNQREELRMAIKMGLIVLTDMLCWLPIIILSILVQSGRHTVRPVVYTWIVTFVLPINSAINPFLYTLATVILDTLHKYRTHASSDIQNRMLELSQFKDKGDTSSKTLLEEHGDVDLHI